MTHDDVLIFEAYQKGGLSGKGLVNDITYKRAVDYLGMLRRKSPDLRPNDYIEQTAAYFDITPDDLIKLVVGKETIVRGADKIEASSEIPEGNKKDPTRASRLAEILALAYIDHKANLSASSGGQQSPEAIEDYARKLEREEEDYSDSNWSSE